MTDKLSHLFSLVIKVSLDLDIAIKEFNSNYSYFLQDIQYASLLDLNRLKTN